MDSALTKLNTTFNPKTDVELFTPMFYFGQRESVVEDIFRILPSKSYRTLYDPFCGSASISLAAMNKGVARSYHLNDSYPLIAEFWKTIKDNAALVMKDYSDIALTMSKTPPEYRRGQYNELLNLMADSDRSDTLSSEDVIKKAATFLFINNWAEHNMPIFEEGTIKNQIRDSYPNEQDIHAHLLIIEERIDKSSSLLKEYPDVQFYTGHFFDCFNDVTEDDVVILDPPYPTLTDNIYFRLVSTIQLQNDLISLLNILNKKKVPFLLNYGAGNLSPEHMFDIPGVKHLIRLSHSAVFGPYLEHIYVSENCNIADLPSHIIPFTSYEEAEQRLVN
ncbi:D12 class N6 adenine-specific DNA methyltransferase [uncultured virus]|nr:D12 class N6 adenine-specific DNA methyltransferase [uncultured virus]